MFDVHNSNWTFVTFSTRTSQFFFIVGLAIWIRILFFAFSSLLHRFQRIFLAFPNQSNPSHSIHLWKERIKNTLKRNRIPRLRFKNIHKRECSRQTLSLHKTHSKLFSIHKFSSHIQSAFTFPIQELDIVFGFCTNMIPKPNVRWWCWMWSNVISILSLPFFIDRVLLNYHCVSVSLAILDNYIQNPSFVNCFLSFFFFQCEWQTQKQK